MILGGAPDEVVRAVNEGLTAYISASRGPQEDVVKAARLRAAFVEMTDWILAKRVPMLNDAQWLFLSTGAIGAKASFQKGSEGAQAELMPAKVYQMLVQGRAGKKARPGWAAPILDVEDRINAIARGELVGMDSASTRRRKSARPLGSDALKGKVKARLEGLVAAVKEQMQGVDLQLQTYNSLRDETVYKGVKLNFEALRKFVLISALPGPKNEQATRFLTQIGDKLGSIVYSVSSLATQLEAVGSELGEKTKALEGKLNEMRAAQEEMTKLESGQDSLTAAFDAETIQSIRRDVDTVAQFAVKASESADNKVAFSGSRILVKEQWKDMPASPEECILTVPSVVAAIEKIGKFHVNVFPKDADGQFVLPPIFIEPVRNFVEFFDDRICLSLVSGEMPKKGPKVSLSPLEVHVMKGCGQWLCRDSLYDYRGEINAGTFMGDYSGKVERKTQVKWQGEDKKMTLAVSSQVVDASSRGEAVNDYVDTVHAFINGQLPPQRMSRRKIAVLLRYVIVESIERTAGLLLLHVAQADPQEAKEAILKHAKNETHARELVAKAFEDPQVAKTCGDRDFFLKKLFGVQ